MTASSRFDSSRLRPLKDNAGAALRRYPSIPFAALLLIGTAWLVSLAFHGNLWFDEAYSVALARWSFADIVRIGSADVHPVLYYFALHVLYLLFGENLVVYRLFTLAGAVATAALGAGPIRRDDGIRAGLVFCFLALFTPYVAHMAVELRMYSWCGFCVSACFVYGRRIARLALKASGPARSGAPISKPAAGTWAVFFLSSLAAAYLHYYGAIAAFLINVGVLLCLLRVGRDAHRELATLLVGAVAQVLAYLPWLLVALSQINRVMNGFWIKRSLRDFLIQPALFPFTDGWVLEGIGGLFGPGAANVLGTLFFGEAADMHAGALAAGVALTLVVLAGAFTLWRRVPQARSGLALFGFVWGAMVGVSLVRTPVFTFRYLYVVLGPLLLAVSQACSRAAAGRTRGRVPAGVFCLTVALLSLIGAGPLVTSLYSPDNAEPVAFARKEVARSPALQVRTQDPSAMGVFGSAHPPVSLTYEDPWGSSAALEAFAPSVRVVSTRKDGTWLPDAVGREVLFVCRPKKPHTDAGRRAAEQAAARALERAAEGGWRATGIRSWYRPYERVWYVVVRAVSRDAAT